MVSLDSGSLERKARCAALNLDSTGKQPSTSDMDDENAGNVDNIDINSIKFILYYNGPGKNIGISSVCSKTLPRRTHKVARLFLGKLVLVVAITATRPGQSMPTWNQVLILHFLDINRKSTHPLERTQEDHAMMSTHYAVDKGKPQRKKMQSQN